ncbi:ABC transporter ATP-binding protein/permease [Planococcus sp. CP5-4]|uniref:ABC transporter ATP-binding protein n=1 Tax=unclassified Planococcus (in: firmicutes) TaxID=2662419 RepID=UPI001C21358A|nr:MULTISPECIES: ABC transporter ATP-binding protein [unclassified Planococcus (in: firmicutes)]MBU9673775.1 ABC transporter ATP-binding protein/permease [Planococcus sp. CP5-4_YE]MBV0908903.1 ABC transporter ATP-binding protein/permease [Planococcus sp. CP5-4_UN]MBW6063952.1 ABC transporter ATP-binding protein/permease [Planococcus sp. CP5-4]
MIKILKNLSPYKWIVLGVIALVFAQSMAELFLPTLMADIIDNGVVQGNIPYIWRIGGWMLLVSAIGAIAAIFASYYSAKAAMGLGRDLRQKVFKHVGQFSLQEFDEVGTASLITRTTNDITQVQQVVIMMLRMVISAPVMLVGGLILAISKDARLSLVIIGAMPVLAVSILLILKYGIPLFQQVQKQLDGLNLVVRENLTGIRVIRAFNRETEEKARMQKANRELADVSIKVNKVMAFLMPVMMLVMNMTVVAVIWFGGIRISNGAMQIGDLMAFIQYVMMIMFALVMASFMFVMIPRAAVSAKRINEVLEMQPAFKDDGTEKANRERGTLEFDDVTFYYPGASEPALSHISFTAKPGEITALIGGTGSGKSTLVNLVPRFYEATNGTIRVNGVDIREAPQQEIRSKIGFVPQKSILFTGTIADNIRFGKQDASQVEVDQAASIAQAQEFINRMEGGYAAEIEQGGSNLSGGQKQRLSIARALIRKPDLYIFDDSFSALDYKTDAKLRRALKNETKNATVLLVAQRVSTVVDADRILVLEKGRVVGMGTHDELLESNEVYREIALSQLSEEEIA